MEGHNTKRYDYQHCNPYDKRKDYNVYFAKGHKFDSYPGNKLYRKSINFYSVHYKKASSKMAKRIFVDKVIATISSKHGRFYLQIRKGENKFEEVGNGLRSKSHKHFEMQQELKIMITRRLQS